MHSAYALKNRSSCRMRWSCSARKPVVTPVLPDTASGVDTQDSLKETCLSAVRPDEILNFPKEVNYCQNPQVHGALRRHKEAKWRLPIIVGRQMVGHFPLAPSLLANSSSRGRIPPAAI